MRRPQTTEHTVVRLVPYIVALRCVCHVRSWRREACTNHLFLRDSKSVSNCSMFHPLRYSSALRFKMEHASSLATPRWSAYSKPSTNLHAVAYCAWVKGSLCNLKANWVEIKASPASTQGHKDSEMALAAEAIRAFARAIYWFHQGAEGKGKAANYPIQMTCIRHIISCQSYHIIISTYLVHRFIWSRRFVRPVLELVARALGDSSHLFDEPGVWGGSTMQS